MADNKKAKQDYREALAAQAAKVLPKDKRKETLTYEVGGEPVTIVRGDMSDEAWEKVKAQVAPKEQSLKSKSLDWPTLMSLGQNLDGVADSVVSKEDKKLVARMPEWDRAEFLRQRFRVKGYDVPLNSADDEKETLKKQPEKQPESPPPAQKPSGPTPDEWTPFPTENKPKSLGTQTEDDQMLGKGSTGGSSTTRTAGMSPRGQMLQMAMGATPSTLEQTNASINQTSNEAMQGLPAATPSKKPSVEVLRSLVREEEGKSTTPSNPALVEGAERQINTQYFGNDPVTAGAQGESGQLPEPPVTLPPTGSPFDPPQPGAPGLADYAQEFGRVMTGQPNLNEQQMAAREDAAAVPPAASQMGAPVTPAPAPVGGSMTVKGSVPGNVKLSPPQPSEREKQIAQAAREEQALIASGSALAQEKIGKAAELMRENLNQRDALAADEAKRQAAFENTLRQRETALLNLQQQVLDLSKQDIDPNRFWNNKSDGQKAAAVIAGALFGFTGQGMQWLSRLDSLVAQDIQAQAQDLQRRRGALSDAAGIENNLVAMAERQGLRGKAAYDAAMAAAKENLANQIQLNSMNYAQPELKIQAEQLALAVRTDAQKHIADYKRQSMVDAQDSRMKQAQINHLERQDFLASVKAAGGAKGEPLPAAVSKRLDESMRAYQNVVKLAELAENSGMGDRLKRAAKESVPGAIVTGGEEKANADLYGQLQVELMKQRAGGALQSHEVELLGPLVGGARSGLVDAAPTARKTAAQFRDQLLTTLRSEQAAGRDVSEYLQVLQSIDAGMSKAPPSYATPR